MVQGAFFTAHFKPLLVFFQHQKQQGAAHRNKDFRFGALHLVVIYRVVSYRHFGALHLINKEYLV